MGKTKRPILLSNLQKGTQPCWHFDFSPERPTCIVSVISSLFCCSSCRRYWGATQVCFTISTYFFSCQNRHARNSSTPFHADTLFSRIFILAYPLSGPGVRVNFHQEHWILCDTEDPPHPSSQLPLHTSCEEGKVDELGVTVCKLVWLLRRNGGWAGK